MDDLITGVDWRQVLASTAGSLQAPLNEGQLPKTDSERKEVLLAVAEIAHRLRGNSKCDVCRAPVRAVMRTVGIDDAGRSYEYECLCRRCLEAEKAYCRKVTSYVSGVVFDESVNRKELVSRPRPVGDRAAA